MPRVQTIYLCVGHGVDSAMLTWISAEQQFMWLDAAAHRRAVAKAMVYIRGHSRILLVLLAGTRQL